MELRKRKRTKTEEHILWKAEGILRFGTDAQKKGLHKLVQRLQQKLAKREAAKTGQTTNSQGSP